MGISALLASQILDASATGRSVITGADASAIRTTLGLGTLATQSATITDYLTIASAASTYQPLDSDLTSIAALSTTAFGRGLLTEVSATTARSTLGLGTLSTQSPTGTPSASTFLRGDFSWQTIDLSGYVPYSGATGAVNLGSNSLTAGAGTFSGLTTSAINRTGDLTVSVSGQINVNTNIDIGSALRLSWGGGYAHTLGLASSGWASGAAGVLTLFLDTDVLSLRRTTNAQTFRVHNTFTDASNYERAKIAWESNVLRIGTEKAGTGSARALELQTDGTTRLTIGTDGVVTRSVATASNIGMILKSSDDGTTQPLLEFQNSSGAMLHRITTQVATFANLVVSTGVTLIMCNVGSTGYYQFGTRSIIYAPANAQFSLRNLADTSGATLDAATDGTLAIKNRLGTSAANITAAAATFSGNVTVSAVNLVTDTTTGTKIGTATTQKLGFYNATPVVQPTAVADATDAASVITQLNALLSRMRNLGLIAT